MNYDVKRAALIEYLKVKTAEADWHGVADAACDLRVLEANPPATTVAPKSEVTDEQKLFDWGAIRDLRRD